MTSISMEYFITVSCGAGGSPFLDPGLDVEVLVMGGVDVLATDCSTVFELC